MPICTTEYPALRAVAPGVHCGLSPVPGVSYQQPTINLEMERNRHGG